MKYRYPIGYRLPLRLPASTNDEVDWFMLNVTLFARYGKFAFSYWIKNGDRRKVRYCHPLGLQISIRLSQFLLQSEISIGTPNARTRFQPKGAYIPKYKKIKGYSQCNERFGEICGPAVAPLSTPPLVVDTCIISAGPRPELPSPSDSGRDRGWQILLLPLAS